MLSFTSLLRLPLHESDEDVPCIRGQWAAGEENGIYNYIDCEIEIIMYRWFITKLLVWPDKDNLVSVLIFLNVIVSVDGNQHFYPRLFKYDFYANDTGSLLGLVWFYNPQCKCWKEAVLLNYRTVHCAYKIH